MTSSPYPNAQPAPPIVQAFPAPGLLLEHAYRQLDRAQAGDPADLQALGNPSLLPRPWDPASCVSAPLRAELWHWLEAVACWHNHEHVWDTGGVIPACWPRHPHLIHQLAVLADQRHQAGQALTSDLLEDWHRYSLPAFTERMQNEIGERCTDGHQPWPAKGRYHRHTNALRQAGRSALIDPARFDGQGQATAGDEGTLP